MCVHGEFHQYPRLGPRPQPSLESHFANSKIVFVFNDDHEPPLSLLRVDPLCVGDDPERGWELSSSCRRRGKFEKQLGRRLFARRAPKANWQLLSWEGLLVWEQQPGYC